MSLASLPAQGLQLDTRNAPQATWYFTSEGSGQYHYLPPGPVTFPSFVYLGVISLDRAGNRLEARQRASQLHHFYTAARTSLTTVVTAPAPSRVHLEFDVQVDYNLWLSPLAVGAQSEIDVGADGILEHSASGLTSTPQTTLPVLCDRRGTEVRWTIDSASSPSSGASAVSSAIVLDFVEPNLEPVFGPNCAGELGCQHGDATFDRVFVASLPSDATFAWLMGGDTQWNVQLPSFACPLLVQPQFILGVPLLDGPNNRKFVDFEATFPPIPGLTFYTQGIAISGGTFIGTNGVVVQT